MTEAAINAEIDRELEISQGSWGGNTFGAKSREGSYGGTRCGSQRQLCCAKHYPTGSRFSW